VRKITIDITTSFAEGAGTEGQVFFGIGGREFRLDIDDHEDFERGDEMTYELGEGANVKDRERNDPRKGMPIDLDAVLTHPVYLRLVSHKASDDWNIANVRARVVAEEETLRFSALEGGADNIWLGPQSGSWLYLRRT
jgi:hypothetical protein